MFNTDNIYSTQDYLSPTLLMNFRLLCRKERKKMEEKLERKREKITMKKI